MGKAHEVAIGADGRAFDQGIRSGVIRPTEDAVKALEKLEDAAGDAGRDGTRDLDKLEESLKDVQQQTKDAERSMGDLGTGGVKGFDKASNATEEFKNEALANVSEVASSFDGSMESIGEVVQGTLGGVSSNLGALGLAAVPIAASVGLITEAFVNAGEATDEARESAYEYGLTVAASGQYADASSRINELTGSVEGLKKVQDIATVAGWDQQDVVTALATGDGLPALTKAFNDGASATMVATTRTNELQGALDGTAQGFELAGQGADLQARALYNLATQAGAATGATDELGNVIVQMPDGKEVVIDAQTKTAYENLDAFDARTLDPKVVPVSLDTTEATRQYNAFRSMVNQRLGVPVTLTPPSSIAKPVWP